jgi:hypothetical protein
MMVLTSFHQGQGMIQEALDMVTEEISSLSVRSRSFLELALTTWGLTTRDES